MLTMYAEHPMGTLVLAIDAQASLGILFAGGRLQRVSRTACHAREVVGSSSIDALRTAEGPLLCIPQMLLQGGCQPSVIQYVTFHFVQRQLLTLVCRQTIGSKYLKAQNTRGLQALVPTISVYTIQDDIIQPEIINPTSVLPGAATSVSVQELCGLTYLADHFTSVIPNCSRIKLKTRFTASHMPLPRFT
jgi:hypothetical protein